MRVCVRGRGRGRGRVSENVWERDPVSAWVSESVWERENETQSVLDRGNERESMWNTKEERWRGIEPKETSSHRPTYHNYTYT